MAPRLLLTKDAVVVRGNPLSADVSGETVLMSVEAGKYYGLDGIGSDIWARLETPIRIEALCAALEAEYQADATRIEGDVLTLLDELLAQGLIEVRN